MRRSITIQLIALSLLAVTTQASAQSRRGRGLVDLGRISPRGGFYLTGGLGAGRESFKFSDENSYSEALTKPTFTLRLGGTPDPVVRLGGEFFGWSNEEIDRTEYFGALLASVQFYPVRESGLWLKGGVGMAFSGQDFKDPQYYDANETGLGWSVGVGYEAQLSRSVAIGPAVEFYQGSFTKRDEATLYDRVLNIGAQITFQTGGHRR